MRKALVLMKSGFTLIEMTIVLLVIGILMGATMKFGSNRITDLKAQTIKEQFVGRYNDLYSQNMTSRFRDNQTYEQLTIVMGTSPYYILDNFPKTESASSGFLIQNIRFVSGATAVDIANLVFVPYQIGCTIRNDYTTGDILYFDFVVPENGKQYCFEIPSETCKLIETKCN